MSVKPPSKVSLSWWKKNYPNSMPTNKAVEKLLAVAESGAVKLAASITKTAEKVKDLSKLKKYIDEKMPYGQLTEELRRSKVTVTKEKHTEFVKAIDVLIDLVRKDADECIKLLGPLLAGSGASDTSKTSSAAKLLAMLDSKYHTILTKSQAWVKKAGTDGPKASDVAEVASFIGRNRFAQGFVTKTVAALEKGVSSAKLDKNSPEDSEVRIKALGIENSLKKVLVDCQKVDKALLQHSISILGDEKGKKLFMKAPEKAIKLD